MKEYYVYSRNIDTKREECCGIYDTEERAIERIITLYQVDEQSTFFKHKHYYWLVARWN